MSKWISVKDKLPSKDGKYLVTKYFWNMFSVSIRYFTLDLSEHIWYGEDKTLKNRSGWYHDSSEWGNIVDDNVVAWQELPEPYKDS